MKRLIIYFLIFLVAVWLGITLQKHPGYVLISLNSWSIETSLWFAVIVLILLFLVFYFLLRTSSVVHAFAIKIKSWFINRKQRKAHQRTIEGLYELIEGNWLNAEKKLSRAAKYSDMALINYLAAAYLAQKQSASDRSDKYIQQAQNLTTSRPTTFSIAHAKILILNKKWEEAIGILKNLLQENPKFSLALKLLQQAYFATNAWEELRQLLPVLRKRRIFSANEINQIEQAVYQGWLENRLKAGKIEFAWAEVPPNLQKNAAILAIYVRYLLAANNNDEAEYLLKQALRHNLDHNLLNMYASFSSTQPLKQLGRAEKWLKLQPQNADLLLCLGRICHKQMLWGRAKFYLEKSLRIKPSPQAFYELGQIMEAQNDNSAAMSYYTKGIEKAINY